MTGDICTQTTIGNATKDTKNLDIIYESNIKAFIEKNFELSKVKPVIELQDNLKAPIKKGAIVGKVKYEIDGISYSSNLLANSDVEAFSYLFTILKFFIIISILIALYLILSFTKKKSKKAFNKRF